MSELQRKNRLIWLRTPYLLPTAPFCSQKSMCSVESWLLFGFKEVMSLEDPLWRVLNVRSAQLCPSASFRSTSGLWLVIFAEKVKKKLMFRIRYWICLRNCRWFMQHQSYIIWGYTPLWFIHVSVLVVQKPTIITYVLIIIPQIQNKQMNK